MNEYTAAFKIIENSMHDLKERANKLEKYWNNTDQYYKNVEDKHIKMVQDLTQGNVIMQAQIKLKAMERLVDIGSLVRTLKAGLHKQILIARCGR